MTKMATLALTLGFANLTQAALWFILQLVRLYRRDHPQ